MCDIRICKPVRGRCLVVGETRLGISWLVLNMKLEKHLFVDVEHISDLAEEMRKDDILVEID